MASEKDNPTPEELFRGGVQSAPFESTETVIAPGAKPTAFTIKINSLVSYNFYKVVQVDIGDAGSTPVEIGSERVAVNAAEPFDQTGTISAGTYAIMFHVSDKNVFYVKP